MLDTFFPIYYITRFDQTLGQKKIIIFLGNIWFLVLTWLAMVDRIQG